MVKKISYFSFFKTLFYSILIITLIDVYSLLFAHEEPKKTLWEKNKAQVSCEKIKNAKVKTITRWNYVIEKNSTKGPRKKNLIQEYDQHGRNVFTYLIKNDTITQSAAHIYDNDGDLVADFDFNNSGIVNMSTIFIYDTAGRVKRGYTYNNSGKLINRYEYGYYADQNKIVFIKYDNQDSVEYTIDYNYSQNYDISDYKSAIKRSRDGIELIYVEKIFDQNDLLIEKKVNQYEHKNFFSYKYDYNIDGSLNKITKLNKAGEVETITYYTYNYNGLLALIKTTDKHDKLISLFEFEYEYYCK